MEEKIESRRSFIKKAAYVAPTIIALGAITNPITSSAASCTAANPCTNDGSNSGPSTTPSTDPGNNDEGGFKGVF
ncbi:MAG: hypothetical protein C0625_15860 [Arcobacter sp.]|nr:MAG: hypothetical protein C0625_15860 [Arcobacter sp.]